MRQRLIDVLVNIAIIGALAAYSMTSRAAEPTPQPVKFDVCGDDPAVVPVFRAPKGADALEVWCPGATRPALTFKGCVGPRVRKVGDGYQLTCTSWNRYEHVPVK